MRILFAGSPAIAIPSLKLISDLELEGKGIALAGILTNVDCRRCRRGADEPSDISAAVLKLDPERREKGLKPVAQIKSVKINAGTRKEAADLGADILVSFACRHIFGPRFLALFPLGGINIHPSLLPKYRGASPIPAVILAGEKETAVCIQRLAREMDTGDILAMDRFNLNGRETTLSLSETVSIRAASLLKNLLLNFDSRAACAMPQKGEASYCREIKKEAGLMDWNKGAVQLDAQIRAFTPWPLSYTRRGKDTLFILEAFPLEKENTCNTAPGTVLGTDQGILIQTGNGILRVTSLQCQAKKALDWKAFLNGARDFMGSQLG